ncbi:patatin-like phospholipase family protein [Edaphobacter sp. HDX4]|uniref:patatin-like phospholipase family protein n=1 Tax=Edaphobacter sp. HDX4 TaxID=2794064 RepID=UPI002FE52789
MLEGGGALGLAHIGVIEWLEEHHIPVSYIAGTSMGGLVGGIYATGRSPAEVRELVASIDWNAVLRGQVPFTNLNFRRKQDSVVYPGSIEFGVKNGVRFPEGFNSGQEVQFILDRVALPYSGVENFDQLPIPFACVATDLVSNKEYVFRQGDFATALRSTMSLPGFFSPVRVDGHVFTDGGLLNNLPVDLAKQMGAEITLAVHLETQPMSAKESPSSFGVLGRSISVTIAANEVRSMEMADVLITIPLAKFGSMDYSQADALIKAGYNAAQSKAAVLSRFSVDEATWQKYLTDRTAHRRQAPRPGFVEVAGTDAHSAKAIQKNFQPAINQPVNTDEMQKTIQDILGEGRYASLNYTMVEKNGIHGLHIQANEKSYAPPIIRPQITLDGSQYNNVLFSLGGRITFLNIGSYGSELRNDVIVGSEYGIRTEYFHPVSVGSKWFVAPTILFDSNAYNAYNSDGSLASVYRAKRAGGGVDIGYLLGRSQEFRIGYYSEYLKYSLQVGRQTEPTVSGREGYAQFQYTLLHVNDPVIPTAGQLAAFNTRWTEAYPNPSKAYTISAFPSSQGGFSYFVPLSKRNTLVLSGGGGTVYGTRNSNIGLPVFSIGGPRLFAAYGTNEILTNEYAYGQLGYVRELATLPPILGGNLYFLGRVEGGTYQRFDTPVGLPTQYRHPADGVAGLIVNTIFGPVLVGGAVGDAGRHRFFFLVGRVF